MLSGVVVAVLGAAGMYWLKRAATGEAVTSVDHFFLSLLGVPGFWYGVACYAVAFFVLMHGLRGAEISQFFPATVGLNVLLVALVGWAMFAEHISPMRLVGIALLLGGIVLVVRS